VKGDDVYLQLVAHSNHLAGVLDAAPAQVGDMYHPVHTADVHKNAITGHALHRTGVALAHLDVGPHLGGGGGPLLLLHGFDGANHPAAGTVDLGDMQTDLLLDQLAHVRLTGQTGLGSGDENPYALDEIGRASCRERVEGGDGG